MSDINISAPDLTQRPPRSARVRLGGYALLPRMLDKGRATLVGKNGDYHYACPLDQHFVSFVGIDTDALKEQLAAGKGDGEILEWIEANARHKRAPWEVQQWSHYHETRVVSDLETRDFYNKLHMEAGPKREDIATWPDLLDLDDYVSFGGKA
jgi:hypothetical protein